MDTKIVYSYHPHTGEYLGATLADRSPLDIDEIWLLPAHSTELHPPLAGERQAAVFLDGAWSLLQDWRGIPLWCQSTARPIAAQLGETPDDVGATELQPPAYGVWTGKSWDVDQAAQRAGLMRVVDDEMTMRRMQADAAITPLQDAADLKIATPTELASLTAWRRYRVELSRIPEQQGYPLNINWPLRPQ
ncbi:hypothetical protein DK842_21415 [Chromobacterium phragmitis]|uniref:tail fiber assembly protein n=1 Tax=Chromobacterium phragmitis TaxID=2202141 RepID=UPI000DEC7C12|nr:tail fiber assembly protein [Chromobacterium phragmitis]AXE32241.1 hypothetical protein DK842_21415 [Chromobacterium phragmitis]